MSHSFGGMTPTTFFHSPASHYPLTFSTSSLHITYNLTKPTSISHAKPLGHVANMTSSSSIVVVSETFARQSQQNTPMTLIDSSSYSGQQCC